LLAALAALTKMSRWLRFLFILTGASELGWPVNLWLHDIL